MRSPLPKMALFTAALLLPLAARASLPAPVTEALAKHGIPASSVSTLVIEVDSKKPLASANPNTPRNPASVMKLVTTLAALEVLGPAHSWKTRYYLDGELDKNGTLHGDLVIKGGGDPYLVLEQFWRHLLRLREKGLKHISGDLAIDNSAFSLPPHDPGAFDKQPYRLYNVGASATLVNFNATRFGFYPHDGIVNIIVDPPLPNLRVVDQLKAKPGRCRGKYSGWSHQIQTRKQARGMTAEAIFKGTYGAGCGDFDLRRSVLPHDDYTYGVFKTVWEKVGGTLAGKQTSVALDQETAKKPFVIGGSKTLAEVIAGTNKYSNNIMARQLLMSLALDQNGEPATREQGVAVIHQWAAENNIRMPELKIDNGAGLSRDIRISAQSLANLLAHGWHSNYQPEFLSSLSLTAIDGTTRKRLKKLEPDGRVRLKTGLLNGTRSVAGYVKGDSGKQYAVVMMINDKKINYSSGNQIQDALLTWVLRQ